MKTLVPEICFSGVDKNGILLYRIREDPKNLGEESKGKTKEGANDPKTNGDMLSHRQVHIPLSPTISSSEFCIKEKQSSAIYSRCIVHINSKICFVGQLCGSS